MAQPQDFSLLAAYLLQGHKQLVSQVANQAHAVPAISAPIPPTQGFVPYHIPNQPSSTQSSLHIGSSLTSAPTVFTQYTFPSTQFAPTFPHQQPSIALPPNFPGGTLRFQPPEQQLAGANGWPLAVQPEANDSSAPVPVIRPIPLAPSILHLVPPVPRYEFAGSLNAIHDTVQSAPTDPNLPLAQPELESSPSDSLHVEATTPPQFSPQLSSSIPEDPAPAPNVGESPEPDPAPAAADILSGASRSASGVLNPLPASTGVSDSRAVQDQASLELVPSTGETETREAPTRHSPILLPDSTGDVQDTRAAPDQTSLVPVPASSDDPQSAAQQEALRLLCSSQQSRVDRLEELKRYCEAMHRMRATRRRANAWNDEHEREYHSQIEQRWGRYRLYIAAVDEREEQARAVLGNSPMPRNEMVQRPWFLEQEEEIQPSGSPQPSQVSLAENRSAPPEIQHSCYRASQSPVSNVQRRSSCSDLQPPRSDATRTPLTLSLCRRERRTRSGLYMHWEFKKSRLDGSQGSQGSTDNRSTQPSQGTSESSREKGRRIPTTIGVVPSQVQINEEIMKKVRRSRQANQGADLFKDGSKKSRLDGSKGVTLSHGATQHSQGTTGSSRDEGCEKRTRVVLSQVHIYEDIMRENARSQQANQGADPSEDGKKGVRGRRSMKEEEPQQESLARRQPSTAPSDGKKRRRNSSSDRNYRGRSRGLQKAVVQIPRERTLRHRQPVNYEDTDWDWSEGSYEFSNVLDLDLDGDEIIVSVEWDGDWNPMENPRWERLGEFPAWAEELHSLIRRMFRERRDWFRDPRVVAALSQHGLTVLDDGSVEMSSALKKKKEEAEEKAKKEEDNGEENGNKPPVKKAKRRE